MFSVVATPGSGSLTTTNGSSIPAGGCTASVDVTANVSGDYTNTIPAGSLQTSAGNNPNPATAMLHVSAISATALSTACDTTFVANQSFSMTATVAGANPGGDTTFLNGGVSIGDCVSVALNAGAASCSTTSLPIGIQDLTAAYGGDLDNSSSNSPSLFVLVLNPADAIMRYGFEEMIAGCPSM